MTKTISLELDAYERLKAARLQHESFSQTVRRIVPPPPGQAGDLLARVKARRWGGNVNWDRVISARQTRRRRPRA